MAKPSTSQSEAAVAALKNVATPSAEHVRFMQAIDLILDLLGGTQQMQKAREKWLQKEEGETKKKYDVRLGQSVLEPIYEDAVSQMVGKILGSGVQPGEDFPAEARAWWENIDRNGTGLVMWLTEFAFCAIAKSRAGILVEMPAARQPLAADGAPRKFTDKEVKDLGLRPYFVVIEPENLIAWKKECINGRERYVQLRIREWVDEPAGDRWNMECVEQIRVIEPGYWWTYRKNEKGEWADYESGTTGLAEISYVDYFPLGKRSMDANPFLDGLARLNLRIFQTESDYANIVHVVQTPFLFGAGFDPDSKKVIVVSTDRIVKHPKTDASLTYVEHTGKAIEAGDKYLQRLYDRADEKSKAPSVASAHPQTATGEVRAEINVTTDLKIMSEQLQDALEQAFQFAFEYAKIAQKASKGSIVIPRNFGLIARPVSDLTMLVQLANVEPPAVSSQTLFQAAKLRGLFPEEHTWEEEKDRIDEQLASLPAAPPELNPDGTPVNPDQTHQLVKRGGDGTDAAVNAELDKQDAADAKGGTTAN